MFLEYKIKYITTQNIPNPIAQIKHSSLHQGGISPNVALAPVQLSLTAER